MEADRIQWRRDYCIPSKTEAGHAVMDSVLAQLEDYLWAQKDVFAIHLSLEEALVNAIRHGNQSNNRLCVNVHLEISPERFVATILDEGPGFDPDNLPDPTLEDFLERPCGRGVKLMRSFMSRVTFNAQGNEVTLEKVRSTPVPPELLEGLAEKNVVRDVNIALDDSLAAAPSTLQESDRQEDALESEDVEHDVSFL